MKRVLLKRFLPLSFQKWLDNSNSPLAQKVTAKVGLLATKRVGEVLADTTTATVAFCPICALAIKVGPNGEVGVFLHYDDRTEDNPNVRIKREQTLFVECRGHHYQVGCHQCGAKSMRDKDLFGVIDASGNLIRHS